MPWNGKTALDGRKMTKRFVICKQLKAQGCRVVLLETSKYWMVASRFSNCVDRFATVPRPEKDPDAFLEAVRALAVEEKADLFVPVTSPVASQYEAHVASVLPAGCRSWSLDPDEVEALDDKMQFCASAAALGLDARGAPHRLRRRGARLQRQAPRRRRRGRGRLRVGRRQGAGRGGAGRHLDASVHLQEPAVRLDAPPRPLHAAVRAGEARRVPREAEGRRRDDRRRQPVDGAALRRRRRVLDVRRRRRRPPIAFSDNRASLSCFNYLPARDPQLRAWVEAFCKARRLSGIVCIDFIVDDATGVPFAIECNPRFSSNIAAFYNNPEFGAALVAPDEVAATVEPRADVVETYWLFSEAWAALTKPGAKLSRAPPPSSAVLFKKDAYFDVSDPLPFLGALFVHLPTLLARNVRTGNKWAKIDPASAR